MSGAVRAAVPADLEARIRGFDGPGDDKVIYWKSLVAEPMPQL